MDIVLLLSSAGIKEGSSYRKLLGEQGDERKTEVNFCARPTPTFILAGLDIESG